MEDQGWWEVVELPEGTLAEKQSETVAGKDRKLRSHLLQCLPDDLLMQVATKKSGKEVWDSLKARFVGAVRVRDARLQTLKSEFDGLKMKEEESLDQYTGKLTAMSVKYSNLGWTLDDAALVKKLFDTVPDRYINVIAGIEQFYDLSKLAFHEAVRRLKAFEERMKRGAGSVSNNSSGQLLLTQDEWESRYKKSGGGESSERGSGGSQGRGRGRGRGRGGRGDSSGRDGAGGTRDKSHIKCFKCHKYGHYANRCPEARKEETHHARVDEGKEPQALMLAETESVVSESKGEKVYLQEGGVMLELHLTGGGDSSGDMWYLDNGASNHMTGDLGKFSSLDEGVTSKVRFGDGSTVEIKGRGTILFQCKTGDQWALTEVFFIPKLRSNLISLGQLTENGHRILLDDDVIEVCEKNPFRLIMRVGRTQNRLYKVELKIAVPVCFLSSVTEQA